MSFIRTYSGVMFDLAKFDEKNIKIVDIAHALSNQCRYNGHSHRFYSVAEHCVRASKLCQTNAKAHVLMHDASEAYMGDVVSPLKNMMPWYKEKENELIGMIYKKYCTTPMNPVIDEAVHSHDRMMLELEMSTLWTDDAGLIGWDPKMAERKFILRYLELCKEGLLIEE